jgi:RND family efflux transporter MFP subunit
MTRPAPLATLRTAVVSVLFVLLAAHVTADPTETNSTAFPGRIEALNQADVSTEVASVVSMIHFKPGQLVQAGETLFTLDPTDFELSLETQRVNVLRAEATLKSAEQDFARLLKLKKRGSATGVQVLKAEVAEAFADAVRAETQAGLRAAQIELDRTVIRAPISGVISPARVSVGSYVKTGSAPLANIVQLDKVRLSYQVPYVARIEQLNIKELLFPDSLLSRVLLTVKVTDTWYHPQTTKPSHVSSRVDYASGAITIWAELANPTGLLRPGMRVTVLSRVLPEAEAAEGTNQD